MAQERIEKELAEARAFQQSLLPAPDAIVNRVAISCRYSPCSALGGDLCDYAAAKPGQTAHSISGSSGIRSGALATTATRMP